MDTLDALVGRHDDPEDRAQLKAAILATGRQRFAHYDRALADEARAREALVKLCPACRRELPASSYGANAARPDGLQVHCKSCRRGPVSQ